MSHIKVNHCGTCPVSGEPCLIVAEYRREYSLHRHAGHVRESVTCSLLPCENMERCALLWTHFPEEYPI